jgi:spermidine synthase
MMLPVGIISGWLFPSITGEGWDPASSIVQVYLFEGIGAFVGGAMMVMLVGEMLSTLGMAFVVGVLVIGALFIWRGERRFIHIILLAVLTLAIFVVVQKVVAPLDKFVDGIKYTSYQVEDSFDTHYGHQSILSRDGAYTLLTDNIVEAVYPDVLTAENLLIPPLIYAPEARRVLLIGRAEFGLMQLADSLPDLSITAIDPRELLSSRLDAILPLNGAIVRLDDDPMAFFSRASATDLYDIIIMNPGDLDSYKNSRLLTERFLMMAWSLLKPDGILFFPTRYDTDRYITAEEKQLLSVVHNVFKSTFGYVALWPGEMTLLFASDTSLFDIPYDSIVTRLSILGYAPQYVSENYLHDRLSELRTDRLHTAVESSENTNSFNRPVLVHYQAAHRAKASPFDRYVMSFTLGRSSCWWGFQFSFWCFLSWQAQPGPRESALDCFCISLQVSFPSLWS